jgi:Beta-lactamase enzyme family
VPRSSRSAASSRRGGRAYDRLRALEDRLPEQGSGRRARPRRRRWLGLSVLALATLGTAGGLYTLRSPDATSREAVVPHDNKLLLATNLLNTPAITKYLSTRAGGVTMALYDATTGQTSMYRPGVTQTTASIIKVGILATLLHQAQEKDQPLDNATAQLATAMIENSDDDAATDLWQGDGGARGVGAFDTLAGLTDTSLNTKGYWGLSTTTAEDQVAMMKAVAYPNALLNEKSRTYELGLMADVEADQSWGVSAGVPAGVTVDLKDGWDPLDGDADSNAANGTNWQVNSIGWIDGDGRNYVLAILTLGNATEGYGIATIQGVAPLIWNELAPAA